MTLAVAPGHAVAAPAAPGAQPRWTGRAAGLLTAACVLAAVIVARDPQALFGAQFWAEDGWVWYPDAYDHGFASLLAPKTGYLQTLPRLAGLAAMLVPLGRAPTLFALVCLLTQLAPPLFLISSRAGAAWPDWRGRAAFALLWVALPNSWEVYFKLPNEQWHLAALALLVLLSRPPATRAGAGFDGAALLLSGLSGPFCIVLAPVAAWLAWTEGGRARAARACVVASAAAVQLACVLWFGGPRSGAPLGAGPRRLMRIVAQQVVFGVFGGQAHMDDLRSLTLWQDNLLPAAIVFAAAGLAAAALLRARPALRIAVASAALILAASLARPQASLTEPQWPQLEIPMVGQRYWYPAMLAWLAVLFALAAGRAWWRRIAGAALLAAVAFGVWSDFVIPPLAPTDFAERARAFEAAAPGTTMTFPIRPQMDRVPMVLTKR